MSDEPTWTRYYDEHADRHPRELLLEVLSSFGPDERDAVDLGCGQGIDTLAMLQAGWRVYAVDGQEEAIRRLLARVPPSLEPSLRAEVAFMEEVDLPPVDLVWASFSLFFSPPEWFGDLWDKVVTAVRPGGRFAGELLGDHDTWASRHEITALSREKALGLFEAFELERFDEEEEDGTATSGPKHWHVFHVVARRPR